MRKLLLAAVCAAATITIQAAADERMTVRLGTEGAYPPFNWIDENGDLQGFDIEIGNAICAAAGFDCTWVVQDWDGIIPGLLAKKYDAIVASMSITEERKKKVAFTAKYYNTPAKFAQKKGAGFTIDAAGLAGKTVGVQRATTHDNFITEVFGDDVEIKRYATQDEAYLDAVAGRLDLLLADSVAMADGFLATDQGMDWEFVGPDFTDPKYFGVGAGIAVRKDDTELLGKLNSALDAILRNGVYMAINDKYFDFNVYGEPLPQ
jgi:arginine/ornithine transport system substrate-binding protein